MDIWLQYLIVLCALILLEGLLAADNAIVMAVMVKHLPPIQQRKALFYGLIGALFFRFIALFLIVYLAKMWYIQLLGALYLLYIMCKHFYEKRKEEDTITEDNPKKKSGFWMTVLKVELADIAFAIDSMLAAVAIAITLPAIQGYEHILVGGINIGPFAVMFIGGFLGVVMMRFAATAFIKILVKKPSLEDAAFLIVGWVGVKLLVIVSSHEAVNLLPIGFSHSKTWEIIFWSVMLAIVIIGWHKDKWFNKK